MADELFYARGVQAVGMDDLRAASGLSLKRLYGLYPAKEALVEAWLERRDTRWRGRLAESVERRAGPAERPLAVFDWLYEWFAEPGFRGCAWINTFGELGATSTVVTAQARKHKAAFRSYLGELVAAAALPPALADELLLLAEGAMVTAAIFGEPDPARNARSAAERLVRGSTAGRPSRS